MTRSTLLLVLFFLFAPAVALAQAAPPQAPQAVFRSGVELVRLDVRVADADGRPVKDVRVEELAVDEGGRRRPVVLFQHVEEPSGTYLEIARRTIGAEVSTNQGSPRGHLYVLVFDQNHITPGNEQRARIAAARFLRARARPGDRVALYALPGPGPETGFSSNIEGVIAELPRVRGLLDRSRWGNVDGMTPFEAYTIVRGDRTVLERVALRSAGTASDADLKAATTPATANPRQSPVSLRDVERTVTANATTLVALADADARQFLLSFADVVRGLSAIEGRKTVVLFSEGFYGDNLAHDTERVAAAAAQAYAVVYAFDLNRRGMDVASDEPIGGQSQADVQNRMEPLGSLAAETDGQLVIDASAHLDEALARVGDESQDYYVVGFEPAATALADRNSYHRVKVTVARPGVTVRTRTGYALRDQAINADRRGAIDSALSAPFSQQGLPLALTTYVMRGTSPGVHRVILSLEAEMPVRSAQATRADVVFVTKSARDGRVVSSGTDAMPLPAAARAGGTTGLGRFQVEFDSAPGEYLMRVVVREPGGAIGSVDRRFEVRPLDGVDVAASDLIIGPRTGGLPARARVAVDEGLVGALEIYARRAGDLDHVEVVADFGRIGDEAPVTSVKADLLPAKTLAGGASRPAQIELPLTGIAPGQYAVRATVKAAGETVAELTREVEVLPAGTRVDTPIAVQERVRPGQILAGDLGRRLLAALGAATSDRAVTDAVNCGLSGEWQKVEAALRGVSPAYAVRVLRGLALFAVDHFAEAATELDGALALPLPPDGAKTRAMTSFLLGWVRTYANDDLGAISAWRSAVVLDPALVPAYLALADTYIRRSQPALAAQVLRAGLAVVPESIELKSKLTLVSKQ